MTIEYPQYRVRILDTEGVRLAQLVDERGDSMGDGIPATVWEVLMWCEMLDLRREIKRLRTKVETKVTNELA